MQEQEAIKNYHYTFYDTTSLHNTEPSAATTDGPWQQAGQPSASGHFTTMKTSTLAEPPATVHSTLSEDFPASKLSASMFGTEVNEPLAYKNPGLGLSISGKSGFDMKGEYVSLKVDKVTNSRQGGQTGTMQFRLVRMSRFYAGRGGVDPQLYTSVCTAQLGELEGGYSFNQIIRSGIKRTDDSSHYPHQKCFILLLQEYEEGQYKMVDYINFD